ncbi:hypothetical protein SAMN05216282_11830 [Cryobacterium psychrotolerans]|uniref:Uncharacterized protein n=1 Tax=Cryobacterium psychrotolerans TaxID=386301 RepID=A0A1G9FUZ3_9MICO|nr:hypothetical protein SAMN05216282_11830 [Cryobacterium psychrotolerans]
MRPPQISGDCIVSAWSSTFATPIRPKTKRVIAYAFFGLAAHVIVDADPSISGLREAEHSPVGIALAAVMPVLSWLERRTGRELGSASAVADSKQTLMCSYLSAAHLGGLLLNSLRGWGWADSIAALVIAGFGSIEELAEPVLFLALSPVRVTAVGLAVCVVRAAA